ncbi:MAG: NAD(P)/FAD-dependent oxidoreductase [Phycisphaeraceae bacterium]|nr:NAD(P)/FAD-dependent oxidoreductase [Phycisphaeraceae bacterium]
MPARPRIVIAGGGFAGAYCAQALERRLRSDEADIVLLDRHNYLMFFPLLIEAGTGSLEPRHAVVPIRSFIRRVDFIMSEVVAIDAPARRVDYTLPGEPGVRSLAADHLVVSLGSVTRQPDPPVPGLREHAFEIKSIFDGIALRDRAISLLELANAVDDPALRREILHWVVVGGNFTGVEAAGEYFAFMQRAAHHYPNLTPDDVRVTLVERSDRILGPLGPELSDYALRHLSRRGMDVRFNTTVSGVTPNTVTLESGDTLRARTVLWCAGIAPSPLLNGSGLPLDAKGYIRCRRDLTVDGLPGVWGIGDSAAIPAPDGKPYPALAQLAIQQGRHAASNIARAVRSQTPVPCDLADQGNLAALGCRVGVASIFGFKISGFLAWFLWRTVYLMKMPGWSRRIRMAADWTLDLLFPRQDVALSIHRARHTQGASL